LQKLIVPVVPYLHIEKPVQKGFIHRLSLIKEADIQDLETPKNHAENINEPKDQIRPFPGV